MGRIQKLQTRFDQFIASTSLYMAIRPDTLATLYLNNEPIEGANIVNGVKLGYNLLRLSVESNKLDIAMDNYSELPKYGFLSTKNFVRPGKASAYGNIILEFNDSVKNRSSACIKDSFNSYNPDFKLSSKSKNGGDLSNLVLGIISLEFPDKEFFAIEDIDDISEFAQKILINLMNLTHCLARLDQDRRMV